MDSRRPKATTAVSCLKTAVSLTASVVSVLACCAGAPSPCVSDSLPTDFGPSQETAASQRPRSLTLVIVLDPRELGIKFVEMTGSVTVVVVVVEKNTTVNSY